MVAEQDQAARLGVVEGRIAEQSVAIQDLREDLREGLKEVNARIDQLTAWLDRMFLSSWAIGGGIIASLIVLIIRGT